MTRRHGLVLVASALVLGCNGEEGTDIPVGEEGIELRVRSVVANQRNLEVTKVAPDALIVGDEIGGDEFDLVEILLALEEIYSIKIPDEELKGPGTTDNDSYPDTVRVSDLIRIVEAHTKKEGAEP